LKKMNACGLEILVVVIASMASMTTWVCPMIWPLPFRVWGLPKYVFWALVNVPSWMPWVWSVMLKAVLAATVPRFGGFWNLDEGMFVDEGI